MLAVPILTLSTYTSQLYVVPNALLNCELEYLVLVNRLSIFTVTLFSEYVIVSLFGYFLSFILNLEPIKSLSLPSTTIIGVAFAYHVMEPPPLKFLRTIWNACCPDLVNLY